MNKTLRRTGAVLGTATLASMATVGPSYAAETVAQSSANAITIAVAGNPNGSGTVAASHDGENLDKTGATHPAVGVLRNQDLLDLGTLAQDATAGVDGRDGVSAACAGVAGDGATLAEVGEGNCLTGGDNIGISMANLDLTGAQLINPDSAIGALGALTGPLEGALGQVTAALSSALADVPIDLNGTAGVIEARCTASPGTATGNARITDAEVFLTVGSGATAQDVTLLKLPTHPEPNTKVVTDLDEVVNAVLEAVEVQLLEGLQGALGQGAALTEALQTQVVTPVIGQIADQLAPLEENVLDGTLNKQTRSSDGQISVTAIDLQVLPAAREFIDASLASVSIANVTCGPNGRVAPAAPAPEAPAPGADEPELPAVPTVVDSGAGSDSASWEAALYAGGMVAAAGFAGLAGYRRFVVSR